jgi:hypothetical protein
VTLPADYLEELVNIELSKRMRWATALKSAGQYELAEEVFPDMPEPQHELEELAA